MGAFLIMQETGKIERISVNGKWGVAGGVVFFPQLLPLIRERGKSVKLPVSATLPYIYNK